MMPIEVRCFAEAPQTFERVIKWHVADGFLYLSIPRNKEVIAFNVQDVAAYKVTSVD